MTPFELALLVGVLAAAAACRFKDRPLLWLTVGVVNYVITSAYYALGLPYHAFFTAMADSAVCLSIYFGGKYHWEMGLYRVYQFSVAISILRLSTLIDDAYFYALLLEACNWLAIFVIIGKGIAERLENGDAYLDRHLRGRVHRALRFVREERNTQPFTKAPQ